MLNALIRTQCMALLLAAMALLAWPAHAAGDAIERLESFNQVQSMVKGRRDVHAGVAQQGQTITLRVNDVWSQLSKDIQQAYVKQSMTTFFGMGGARGLKERPEDYRVEVRHMASNRKLATWDATLGFHLTD